MPEMVNNQIQFNPTLDSADYADGDVLFVPVELTKAVTFSRSAVKVKALRVTWNLASPPQFTLFLFRLNPASFGALNAALGINFADMQLRGASIPVVTADYTTYNSITIAELVNIDQVLQTDDSTTSIWVAAQIDDATVATDLSGKLSLTFRIEQVD